MRPRNRFTSRSRGILLLLVLPFLLLPSTASALEFYVDAVTGLDARSTVEAQSALTRDYFAALADAADAAEDRAAA